MEPDPRDILHAGGDLGELVRQAPRWHRLAVSTRTQKRGAALPHPEPQKFLSLLALQAAQLVAGKCGEGDRPRLLALRSLEAKPSFRLLQALDNAKTAAVKVYIAPS